MHWYKITRRKPIGLIGAITRLKSQLIKPMPPMVPMPSVTRKEKSIGGHRLQRSRFRAGRGNTRKVRAMNAVELLKATRAEGVAVSRQGGKLVLEWRKSPPGTALVENLRRHKAEILLLTRNKPPSWLTEDWLAYFDERAGIAEFDGGFPRIEAGALRLPGLRRPLAVINPPVIDHAQQCLQCELAVECDDKISAAGAAGKRGMLHAKCADKWKVSRVIHARRQLSWLLERVKG